MPRVSSRLLPLLFLAAVAPLLAAAPAPVPAPAPPGRDPAVQSAVDAVMKARLERTVRTLAAFPTRHTLSGEKGADAAARWLEGEFRAISQATGGRLQVERDVWTQAPGPRVPEWSKMTNVVAVLRGEGKPERVIVISGHYDSRVTDVMDTTSPAPGANDDASGVAVVLEAARVMAARRYPVTVVFAAVTGEEQGLYGAAHLARKLKHEKRDVVAMFTNDIVGNSVGEGGLRDDTHVRVFSAGYEPGLPDTNLSRQRSYGTDADTPARTLARAVADAASRYVKGFGVSLVYRNDRYGRGGDHTPFLLNGYPAAVRVTETNEDWRHQHQDLRTENGTRYGDLPEFVDYDYLTRVARVNVAAVAELASAPPAPSDVTLKPDLSPQTTLSWKAPAGAKYCEVLWRHTTAAAWEGARRVDGNTVSLPLSKDDYLFAVRAVSPTGARGLPAIPVAGRP
jgi:hypothetical protein